VSNYIRQPLGKVAVQSCPVSVEIVQTQACTNTGVPISYYFLQCH